MCAGRERPRARDCTAAGAPLPWPPGARDSTDGALAPTHAASGTPSRIAQHPRPASTSESLNCSGMRPFFRPMTRSQPTYSKREHLAPCGRGIADTGPHGLVLPTMAAAAEIRRPGNRIGAVAIVGAGLRWRHSFKAEENGKRDAARNRRWLCRALRCCSCGAWYHAAFHAPLRSRRLSRRVSLALPMRSRDSPVLCPSLFRRTLQTPPSALRACSPLGPDSWLRVDARPRSRASLRARQGRRTGCHGAALMEGW